MTIAFRKTNVQTCVTGVDCPKMGEGSTTVSPSENVYHFTVAGDSYRLVPDEGDRLTLYQGTLNTHLSVRVPDVRYVFLQDVDQNGQVDLIIEGGLNTVILFNHPFSERKPAPVKNQASLLDLAGNPRNHFGVRLNAASQLADAESHDGILRQLAVNKSYELAERAVAAYEISSQSVREEILAEDGELREAYTLLEARLKKTPAARDVSLVEIARRIDFSIATREKAALEISDQDLRDAEILRLAAEPDLFPRCGEVISLLEVLSARGKTEKGYFQACRQLVQDKRCTNDEIEKLKGLIHQATIEN